MPPTRLDSILGASLRTLRRDARPDAELLTRFLELKDEGAFEALVLRHTPAVRAACRSWLRREADIEDATQATFLILVERGRSIRDRAVVAHWLYGVATRVARRLRQQLPPSQPLPEDVPDRAPTGDEALRELLHAEIARLPEKYRLPVQLCYLTGLTTAEAAQRLGWPKGTVLTRLAWARERLQKNLARHGVAPASLAGLLLATVSRPVEAAWLRVTTRAALAILAGESPARVGISGGTVSLMEGVVRAMFYDRVKYLALAALLVVGLAGFGIGHWASASNPTREERSSVRNDADPRVAPKARGPAREKDEEDPPVARPAKNDAPAMPGRRREAVIRLPSGTFTKEVDASPYGHGRLTWTYEEDRVLGLIEASVMGGEVELATEAEYALSSNGTIYGLITSVRLNHLRLPDTEEFAELKPFLGLWTAVEPLVNETLTDLPFSYQFRVQGDRLVISNFRILLAGPNPLGKVGGLLGGLDNELAVLSCFQGLGIALEGTYLAGEAREKAPPKKRPYSPRPSGRAEMKALKGLATGLGRSRHGYSADGGNAVMPAAVPVGPVVPASTVQPGIPASTGGVALPSSAQAAPSLPAN